MQNSINNRMDLEKTEAQIYLNFLKRLNLVSARATQLQVLFLMSRKPSTRFGAMGFSLS